MRMTSVLVLGICSTLTAAETVTLVQGGASDYVIYRDPSTPGSVRVAAEEVQRVIVAATGVELPIVTAPAARMISLADNAASRAAGVSNEGLEEDAFRIATRGGSVYIVGMDSRRNTVGWGGNENRGTLFGAYSFLEQIVNVRWLMSGPHGEDIPRRVTLTVPAMDQTQTPSFKRRELMGEKAGHLDWVARHGGGGWRVNHGHNWDSFPPRSLFREHPEYLALQNGRRMAVPADETSFFQVKFCTSQPGLIQAYADGVIDWLDKHPNERFASISPSDGGQWCQCEQCLPHWIQAPSATWGDFGGQNHSVALLIVKFYNDVAKIVGKRHPDRILAGYVYYDFTFPPEPMPAMEPNVALILAPLHHYGLTRYKPAYRDEFERLCKVWGSASPNMGYYGASTWMRVGIGAPLGPSLAILKHTFKTMAENRFRLVTYYSLPRESAGVHNYLAAKLMWNAQADVEALFRDWVERAYGPGASAMERMYRLLDAEMEKAKIASPAARADYEMTTQVAMDVYLKNYWTMEGLYREALAAAATDAQRARVEGFGESMIILHHALAQAGALERAEQSAFHRDDATYRAFLEANGPAVREMRGAASTGGITGISVPGNRSLAVPRVERSAPVIDGDLSDGEWRIAAGAEQGFAVVNQFSLLGGDKPRPPRHDTRVLVTYDNDYLYLSYRCSDQDIVEGDTVGLVFSAQASEPTSHWELKVNPLNGHQQALHVGDKVDPAATLEWNSAVSQGEGYWAVEMRIAFRSIVNPATSEKLSGAPVASSWRVNVTRGDSSGENSSWTHSPSASPIRDAGRWSFPR